MSPMLHLLPPPSASKIVRYQHHSIPTGYRRRSKTMPIPSSEMAPPPVPNPLTKSRSSSDDSSTTSSDRGITTEGSSTTSSRGSTTRSSLKETTMVVPITISQHQTGP
mmetsp:Transcript_1959/g.4626  ORF Transcript_1959/g.4626 Transcript_1959/m.4626 type:complete len:108 (+) Transcript_1959:117-440(+)